MSSAKMQTDDPEQFTFWCDVSGSWEPVFSGQSMLIATQKSIIRSDRGIADPIEKGTQDRPDNTTDRRVAEDDEGIVQIEKR